VLVRSVGGGRTEEVTHLNSASLNIRAYRSMSGMSKRLFEAAFDVVEAFTKSLIEMIGIWVQ
jgi:hypothetical protein